MSEKLLLIIDHDDFQRHLISMLLAAEHFQLHDTDSAAAALKYLQDITPDLIIAEANLPDMPATDLCRRIKSIRRLHQVPVILVASPAEFKAVKELAPVVGANLVLEKPLGDKGLREHVNTLLSQVTKRASVDIYKTMVPESSSPSTSSVEPVSKPKVESKPQQAGIKPVAKPESSKPLSNKLEPRKAVEAKTPVPNKEPEPAPNGKNQELKTAPRFPGINLLSGISSGKSKKPAPEIQREAQKSTSKPASFETVAIAKDKPAKNGVAKTPQEQSAKSEASITDMIHPLAENPHPKTKKVQDSPKVNPADLLPPIRSKPSSSQANQMSELSLLRKQVEQLIEENEQLKEAIREFKSGTPIISSQSYLNAVEELEALRRLTEQQSRQLAAYQGKEPEDIPVEEAKVSPRDNEKTVWNRIVKGI
ncbi:MAG: response regulator [Trueperaceae bacterium]|nr:response regulator [Trueperaceae bacterium]